MKVKVLKNFAFEKNLYSANKEAEFTKEQVEYLNSASLSQLVKVIEDRSKDEKKEDKPEDNATEKDYEKLTKKKLVEIANDKGIQVDENMTKKEIIEELV